MQRGRDGAKKRTTAKADDEDLMSDSDDGAPGGSDDAGEEEEAEDEEEEETADEKRLRLARAYLGRLKAEDDEASEDDEEDEEMDGVEKKLQKDSVSNKKQPRLISTLTVDGPCAHMVSTVPSQTPHSTQIDNPFAFPRQATRLNRVNSVCLCVAAVDAG